MVEITFTVLFDCKHSRIYANVAPKLGDLLWCPRCRKEVKVIDAPPEWRIRCRRCIYSRAFGAAKLNAELAAARHRRSKIDHAVSIYNGNHLVRTFGAEDSETQTLLF